MSVTEVHPLGDWRALPAGNELDRLVAETLGWRMEQLTIYDAIGPEWWCVRPDNLGDLYIAEVENCPTESLAWDTGFRTYEGCDSTLFRWSRDANDDYLPLRRFYGWMFRSPAEGSAPGSLWIAEIYVVPEDVILATGCGQTLAEARVKAWLALKERELP